MDIRSSLVQLAAIVLIGAGALPAIAEGVYRSVGIDGAVMYSDIPPPASAPVVPEPETASARANTQLDLAEHAFALARLGRASPRDGLRLVVARMTQSDEERVAFYTKAVQAARQQLMGLRRDPQPAGQ